MRERIEALADVLIPAGQHLLEKNGAVYPCGAEMGPDRKIRFVAADIGREEPDPDDLESVLIRGWQQKARVGEVQAVAWCYTVTASGLPGGDTAALKVQVEDADGEVALLYLPFRIEESGLVYRELVRVAGRARVFGVPPG